MLQLIFECGMGVKRISLKQCDIQDLLTDFALNNRNSVLQALHIFTKEILEFILYKNVFPSHYLHIYNKTILHDAAMFYSTRLSSSQPH